MTGRRGFLKACAALLCPLGLGAKVLGGKGPDGDAPTMIDDSASKAPICDEDAPANWATSIFNAAAPAEQIDGFRWRPNGQIIDVANLCFHGGQCFVTIGGERFMVQQWSVDVRPCE